MPSLSELATTSQDDPSPSSGDNEEYERYDVSGLTFTKLHPTVAIGGTAKVLRYFPEWNDDREEYTGQGDAGLIVTDPFLDTESVEGEQRVAVRDNSEKNSGDDIKVVNLDDDDTSEESMGVMFGDRVFKSELFEEWPDDETIQELLEDDDVTGQENVIKIPGTGTGQRVVRTLDVHGRGGFGARRDENGDVVLNENGYPELNDSLIEYHPDWNSGEDNDAPEPVFGVADTEIRPDLEGTRVVIMLARLSDVRPDYDGRAYSWTIFGELDEDRRQELAEQYAENYNESDDTEGERTADDYLGTATDGDEEFEVVLLKPTADFERSESIKRHRGTYSQWNYPDENELQELREAAGFEDDD